MPREERVLVNKVDLMLLSFACMSTWACNLDWMAPNYCYINGMKEVLNLNDYRLNYLNALYAVGTLIFQITSNIILTRVPAEIYMPACEVGWGLFTLATGLGMRFMVGFFSTPCWIGNIHIINLGTSRMSLESATRSSIVVILLVLCLLVILLLRLSVWMAKEVLQDADGCSLFVNLLSSLFLFLS